MLYFVNFRQLLSLWPKVRQGERGTEREGDRRQPATAPRMDVYGRRSRLSLTSGTVTSIPHMEACVPVRSRSTWTGAAEPNKNTVPKLGGIIEWQEVEINLLLLKKKRKAIRVARPQPPPLATVASITTTASARPRAHPVRVFFLRPPPSPCRLRPLLFPRRTRRHGEAETALFPPSPCRPRHIPSAHCPAADQPRWLAATPRLQSLPPATNIAASRGRHRLPTSTLPPSGTGCPPSTSR